MSFMAAEVLYTISPSEDSTVAIEVFKTGLWRRKKHILFFEKFNGTLRYCADHPESSSVDLIVDARSAVCRDAWLKPRKQQEVTRYVREEALGATLHPDIRFSSTHIEPKELRGFVVEGDLAVRGTGRKVRVNLVLNPRKHERLQVDGDANVRLTEFGIKPPNRMFGLIGTKDEALIRMLLWASPAI